MLKHKKKEAIDLLLKISRVIKNTRLEKILNQLSWNSNYSNFYYQKPNANPSDTPVYFNGDEQAYNDIFQLEVDQIALESNGFFNELIIRSHLQLTNDLISGYVQFEHIQPLLKRIESLTTSLERVIKVCSDEVRTKILTIISLRNCSQEIKKIMPLLLAKHYYEQHKRSIGTPTDKTLHLIIDEAHNALSQQSIREQESWKDYRLELFEEIIKEGRKFGVFLTLSSQRPADISPTIMSQIHNFFIHRLVNDKDLFLLDNTISTLDSLSKSMIPNLAKGSCIVTGTSFDLPLVMQISQLERIYQPDSDDVDLEKLWENREE